MALCIVRAVVDISPTRDTGDTMKPNKKFLLLLPVVFFLVLPQYLSVFWIHLFTMILLFVYWTSAWNIIGGLAGEINFYHPLFIASRAYTSTLLYIHFGISPWIGMWVGAGMAVVIGVGCGWICYRARLPHLAFALAALGFVYVGLYVATGLESVTGGTRGLTLRPAEDPANMLFASKATYYYMALVMASGVVLLSWWICRSRLGLYLSAGKGNLLAAEAIGVNTVRSRLIAMAISAALTAIGGTFYAQLNLYIDPHTAVSITGVISMILFCAIGGFATVWGPVVGTLLLMPIGELLRMYVPVFGLHLLLYGVVVILVILFAPHGLVPWFQEYLVKKRSAKAW